MVILIKIIGIVITLVGIIFLFCPKAIKQLMGFVRQGRRLYWAGILRLLFGVTLLLGASQCRVIWVVMAMGILFLIGGVMIFTLGLERLRSIIEWWNKRSLMVLRLWALVVLALGALLIYSA